MATFETFVEMSGTAHAYWAKLTTLDEFIQHTFLR